VPKNESKMDKEMGKDGEENKLEDRKKNSKYIKKSSELFK